jgi:hypothetical protein
MQRTGVTDVFDQDLHHRLCSITSLEAGEEEENNEGWNVVGPAKKGAKGKILWKPDQPEEWVQRTADAYMTYFYALTGKRLEFKLTASTQKYMSMLECARDRNLALSTYFTSRPIIWDLMAGSGADAISFLFDLDPLIVVLCQRAMPEERATNPEYEDSKGAYDIMVKNVKNFLNLYPEITKGGEHRIPTSIRFKHLHAQTYIMSVPDGTEVDCVYLDPSWHKEDVVAHKYEQTPAELFTYLDHLIWTPIARKNIKVGCYVLKTRWNWLEVQKYLTELDSKFIATYSIEAKQLRVELGARGDYGQVQGLFHYMVLIHRDYKTIPARNSQMYWDIVRNGERVWVRKDSVVAPNRPRYSSQPRFSVFTEKNPHDESYFEVTPPKALKQKSRAVGEKDFSEKVRDSSRIYKEHEQEEA